MYLSREGTTYPIEKKLCANTERLIPYGERRIGGTTILFQKRQTLNYVFGAGVFYYVPLKEKVETPPLFVLLVLLCYVRSFFYHLASLRQK